MWLKNTTLFFDVMTHFVWNVHLNDCKFSDDIECLNWWYEITWYVHIHKLFQHVFDLRVKGQCFGGFVANISLNSFALSEYALSYSKSKDIIRLDQALYSWLTLLLKVPILQVQGLWLLYQSQCREGEQGSFCRGSKLTVFAKVSCSDVCAATSEPKCSGSKLQS